MKSTLIILRLVDSFIKNRILGWNFFFFQILKVQLDHLTSRAAAQREVWVTFILNSMCVTFSLEKTEAQTGFSLSPVFWNIIVLHLGVGLFSPNVLSI